MLFSHPRIRQYLEKNNGFIIGWGLVALIFLLDVLLPRGYTVSFFYIIPIMVLAVAVKPMRIWSASLVCAALTIVAVLIKPHSAFPFSMMTFNRCLSIISQLIVTYFEVQRRKTEENLTSMSQALEFRNRELIETNKELENFSYSVSHDLRAPLRAIDGFSRILVDESEQALDEESLRYLGIIRGNALQMGRLIDDLLRFSRLSRQELKQDTVHIEGLVSEAMAILQPEQQDHVVSLNVKPMPPCQGDASLLRQVVTNLLANAIKFSANREKSEIEVGAVDYFGKSAYYIRDNGVGFDMKYANKLFGVFQRLHPTDQYEGTGVGLAICQRIIHRHGGEIWAESSPEQGATFYFTVSPVTKPAQL